MLLGGYVCALLQYSDIIILLEFVGQFFIYVNLFRIRIQEERDQRHRAKRLHREMAPMDADEGSPEPVPEEQRTTRLGLDFLDMSIPFGKGSGECEISSNLYVVFCCGKVVINRLCIATC